MFKAGIFPEIMIKLLQVPKPVLIVFKAVSPICLVLISSLSNFGMHSFRRLVTSQESLGASSRLIELIFDGFAVDLLLAPPAYLSMLHGHHLPHVIHSLVLFAWNILLSFWNCLPLYDLCCFSSWSNPDLQEAFDPVFIELDQGP